MAQSSRVVIGAANCAPSSGNSFRNSINRRCYTEEHLLVMNDLFHSISHHGYIFLGVVCLAEAVGLPVPAALAMLTAGAVTAYGDLHLYFVTLVGVVSMVCGDIFLYYMGRVSGWALLGFLCRLSANPETCILRSAEYF